MKKLLVSAFAVALLFAPALSHAEETDIAAIKCSEFLQSGDAMAGFIFWIDGYLSSASGDTVISEEWTNTLGTHLGTYCSQNPNNTLMDAIEAL